MFFRTESTARTSTDCRALGSSTRSRRVSSFPIGSSCKISPGCGQSARPTIARRAQTPRLVAPGGLEDRRDNQRSHGARQGTLTRTAARKSRLVAIIRRSRCRVAAQIVTHRNNSAISVPGGGASRDSSQQRGDLGAGGGVALLVGGGADAVGEAGVVLEGGEGASGGDGVARAVAADGVEEVGGGWLAAQ